MKRYKLKKGLLPLLILIFIFGFTGCFFDSNKKITLSNDVKKDVTSAEKNSIQLEKIKEFPMDNSEYDPLYWKDDENFIAINDIGNSSENHNIYNVNISTSQATKIATLNDALIVGGLYPKFSGIDIQNTRLLFIRDFKLYLYDISDNTSKVIYDLSEVKNEIEEKYSHYNVERTYDKSGKLIGISEGSPKKEGDKTSFKVEYSSDFILGFKANFVRGTNKYIYMTCINNLRILDLDTGNVVKLTPSADDNEITSPAVPYWMNFQGVLYNKIKNTFYTNIYNFHSDQSVTEDETNVYEFVLNEPNNFKKVIKTSGIGFRGAIISDNGKDIYFNTYKTGSPGDYKRSNSIISFDTNKNTFIKLFEDKSDARYSFTNYNYKFGLIYYEYWNENAKTGDDPMNFLGSIDNGKLKVVENLTPEKMDDMKTGITDIIYNEKGDKFLFRIHYFAKDNSVKGKTYVYAVKNS